jgi:hypothetical protein
MRNSCKTFASRHLKKRREIQTEITKKGNRIERQRERERERERDTKEERKKKREPKRQVDRRRTIKTERQTGKT